MLKYNIMKTVGASVLPLQFNLGAYIVSEELNLDPDSFIS
jgi:hypothetical protein